MIFSCTSSSSSNYSQRDVSLGEETSENRWARRPDCTADGPIYPTWIFPEEQWWGARNGAARCRGAGTRHVTTFPFFVFNDSLKPCQGVTICSGINCCARRHEVDQENAFSVPENGRHDFFSLKLKFWIFWFWGNAYGATAVTVVWIQECGENPMFHLQSQWIPETHLLPVRGVWETSARNPSVSFCDRPLIFWAPSLLTIFCTLIFLSQLHELWS